MPVGSGDWTHQQFFEIADNYWRARGSSFVAAFEEKFGIAPPEPLNSSHRMIIVASALDPASQRIVEYLSQEHEIGINTAFFAIFRDGERQYLSADWLMDQDEVVERTERKVRAPWTGYLFANCGEGEHRSWDDMRKYGFIAAGRESNIRNTCRNCGKAISFTFTEAVMDM